MEINNDEINKLEAQIVTEDITNQDISYKLIIIGESGVGKSCLMLRGMKDEFRENHEVTIGVEYGSFTMKINGKTLKILIWDTAGQESFQSVAKIFYRGADCIFLVYDITNEHSFQKVQNWLKEIHEMAPHNVIIMLVGNMLDLKEKRVIPFEKAVELQKIENLFGFIETSAKSGENVKDLFIKTGKVLFLRDKDKYIENLQVKLSGNITKKSKKCC